MTDDQKKRLILILNACKGLIKLCHTDFDGLHCPTCGGDLDHLCDTDFGDEVTSEYVCTDCDRTWWETWRKVDEKQITWGRGND